MSEIEFPAPIIETNPGIKAHSIDIAVNVVKSSKDGLLVQVTAPIEGDGVLMSLTEAEQFAGMIQAAVRRARAYIRTHPA